MSNYTTRCGTTYHFRFFIPEHYQAILDQKVIKLSLRTGRKRLARRKARALASATRKYLQTLPEENMTPTDKKELQKRLRRFLLAELEKDELLRAMPVPFPDEKRAFQDLLKLHIGDLQGPLSETTKKIFTLFLEEYRIQIPEESIEYHIAGREFCKTLVELYKIILMRADGDFAGEREYMEKLMPVSVAEAQKAVDPSSQAEQHTVSELVTMFSDQAETQRATTQKKYVSTLNEFISITGDRDIKSMSHKILREYVDVLKKLPPNYSKNHPDLHPLEVAKIDHTATISARTINDKLGVVSRFFKWAINQGYMDANYADGKRVPGGKPQHSTHEPYTLEDLQKMFNAPQYVEDKHRSPYQFWMVPLALFTGARQSELAQLRCDDIYQTDGVWCIRIMPDEDDDSSSVKTENAIRTIPLHPMLAEELNFPAFVKRICKQGHERIFPEIKPRDGSYGKVVSQWFNDRFRKKLDLQPPKKGFKKDFHSFRNTFINAAKQARVEIRMVEETVGHASAAGPLRESMSGGYYAQNYREQIRYEELMLKVEFDLDLTHLKKSQYCVG